MTRLHCLTLALAAALSLPAGAEDRKPLDAEGFDAATRGKVMDTWSGGRVYGVEKFLPGRRSVWEDERGCMYGTWEQVGEMICFTYEDDPANPDCWTYFDEGPEGGGKLSAHFQGDPANAPILLTPTQRPMTCSDYLGA